MATKTMQKIMAFKACEVCQSKRACALADQCQNPLKPKPVKRGPGRPKKIQPMIEVSTNETL